MDAASRGYTETVLALAAVLLAAPSLTYRIGPVDLTPPEPLPLGGYTARGGKVCDFPGETLEARAILFERPGLRVALVSADLLTIPESLVEEVRKRLPDDVRLMLVATHTHCAPDSQMLNRRMDFALPGIAKFNEKWLNWHADRIAGSVRDALRHKPEPFRGFEVAYTRKTLNRGRRQFALPDTLAVRVQSASRDPLITHYAAHAVLYGPQHNRTSPDFPGKIRGRGLFLPGAIGDMSPASQGPSPQAQVAHFARVFESGTWNREALSEGPLTFAQVPLRELRIEPNPEFARLNKIPQPLAEAIVRRFAPEEGEITVLRIGKLAFVGVPGEPTAELGRAIRSSGQGMGFRYVLTVSHCNGWMGYILSKDDYERGGYEASLAFHGPQFAERVLGAARTGLHLLRSGAGGSQGEVAPSFGEAFHSR